MLILVDYIEKQTGLTIEVLSNSEQRFIDYQSIASVTTEFESIIQNPAAIVDIGGSSMQVSLFDKDKLINDPKYPGRQHYDAGEADAARKEQPPF